ncbi:MAG: hypothetical protein Fur002_18350 [Anaerolineales bacterium]
MKILFVADARSPIAQNWIKYFVQRGDEVYLASTFQGDAGFPLAGLEFTPVAFSAAKRTQPAAGGASSLTVGLRTKIRQWVGPLTLRRSALKLRAFIEQVQPDLVHALRVPYEGMLAAAAQPGAPLIASIWGNDFTLHAPSNPLMGYYTRKTMNAIAALHADCERDIRLAAQWGFDSAKPSLVAPGNGGIASALFRPPVEDVRQPVIFNPRGFRAYVRNDSFFKAIPLVLKESPQARFSFASMQGEAQAERWIKKLQIENSATLLPPLPRAQIAEVFRSAQIVASPSIHDGTPNSLLEGMACGCFPVAGDLESIREWIRHGENGLLFDSSNPQSIADAILRALKDKDLRRKAAGLNANLIAERAEYSANMKRVEEFYKLIT